MHPTDKSASVTRIVYANPDHRHVGQGLTQTLHTKELLTKQQVASESFKLLRVAFGIKSTLQNLYLKATHRVSTVVRCVAFKYK